MPRIRYLKPDFFKDEDLARYPFDTRLCYQGLWVLADKAGRLEDRPLRLKAEIFPYDNVDIEVCLQHLSECKNGSGKPFIHRYNIDRQRFIQIINWPKHQKPHHTEKESIIPEPPEFPLFEKTKESKLKGNGKGNGKFKPAQSEYGVNQRLNNGKITDTEAIKTFDYTDEFLTFWKAYPNKKGKGEAFRSWKKVRPDTILQVKILAAVAEQEKSEQWHKEGGQFIPNPSTWLNQGRWDDEISRKNFASKNKFTDSSPAPVRDKDGKTPGDLVREQIEKARKEAGI